MDEMNNKGVTGRKILLEIKDLLVGAAFPFIMMIVFGTSLSMFGAVPDTLIRLLAVIGGDLFIVGAIFVFGKQNGSVAYRKFVLGEQKRSLNSTDEKAIYKTGEYSLWKGFVIPLIGCVPYIIIQIISIASPNSFTTFMLEYIFGWAYFPVTLLGGNQAFCLFLIALPVAAHAIGYAVGKVVEEKAQAKIAAEGEKPKKKRGK